MLDGFIQFVFTAEQFGDISYFLQRPWWLKRQPIFVDDIPFHSLGASIRYAVFDGLCMMVIPTCKSNYKPV